MPLPSPNLDDRDFYQLLEAARQQIRRTCPDWTDLSPSDPGWTLVELFAHLTETTIYRLNRLPQKAYIEFLRLMGVSLNPPTAAQVELLFVLNQTATSDVSVPRGTRVTVGRTGGSRDTGRAEPPIFVTTRTLEIPVSQREGRVSACHAEWIEAELVGVGTGLPGLVVFAQRPPLVAAGMSADVPSLIVGVEATAEELSERDPALQHKGKAYRQWREVETFANLGADRQVYQVDRVTGQISFAPAIQLGDRTASPSPDQLTDRLTHPAMLQAPLAQREIRLWYYRGGGPEGNVAAGQLSVLKDPIPGVTVTNPQAATGGSLAETLEEALIRGPLELHALDRAVTASDFELHALKRSGAVSRAKAFTQTQLWRHGTPGTVEVLLVPRGDRFAPLTAEDYAAQETEDARRQIQQALDERRPLGTQCCVNWVRYKTVQVKARLVVHRGENADAVQQRVQQRLYQTINPQVWEFGRPLRVDRIYGMILAEAGVSHVERVRFHVDEVPSRQVQAIAADISQPQTWYAGAGSTLFRSLNNGDSWEAVGHFAGESIRRVKSHPLRPGLIAVTTRWQNAAQPSSEQTEQLEEQPKEQPRQTATEGARIYFSFDCGETWQPASQLGFLIHDIAWISRAGNTPNILMATSKGLYAQVADARANPVQLSVNERDSDMGFYAVAVSTDARGTVTVAVAAEEREGIFLSHQEGRSGSFSHKGLAGKDIRTLAIQQDGPRTFLWAGAYVPGNEAGQGCFRWELPESAEGWIPFERGWVGGSCREIVCEASRVYAASFSAGVLSLDASRSDAAWQAPAVSCGLPIRDTARIFYPVNALDLQPSADLSMSDEPRLLAGGETGVYRSHDRAEQYESVADTEFAEKVMLPPTWLFCSGAHEVEAIDP